MNGPSSDGGPTPGLELEFPARPAYVRTARHAVAALARLHEVPEDVVEDIKLAVSEACNTALSAEDAEDGPQVKVVASAEENRFLVEVFDQRATLSHEVAGPPSDIDTEELPFDRLLSLPVIRGLVDEVAMTPQEGGGVVMRMVVSFGDSGA